MEHEAIVKAHQLKADGTIAAVIPKTIREALGISKGTRLLVYYSDGRVIMRPVESMGVGAKPADGTR